MKPGMPLAKLIGEHEFIIGTDGTQDFVSLEEMILLPGFKKVMLMFANDLNRAKLEGNQIIRFRMDCHAQSTEEII